MAETCGALLSLPVDVLSLVTPYLSGWNILSLWKCGSSTLNRRLGDLGGVRQLSVGDPWCFAKAAKCPSFISHFKKLDQLEISMEFKPLPLEEMQTMLGSWSKSLRQLSLYSVCLSNWSVLEARKNFPQLEVLSIKDSIDAEIDASLGELPSTLGSFTFLSLRKPASFSWSSILDLSLKHLHLSTLPGWYDSMLSQLVAMPLETLRLPMRTLTTDQLRTLPRTIKSLEFRLDTYETIDQAAAVLPREIAHLRVDRAVVFPSAADELKPLGLDSLLTLKLGDGRIGINYDALPSSLTSLKTDFNNGEESQLLQLPKGLKKLVLYDILHDIPPQFVASLPRGLEVLRISLMILNIDSRISMSSKDLPDLPPNIKELDLWCTDFGPGSTALMPRSLTKLSAKMNLGKEEPDLLGLPPQLKHLAHSAYLRDPSLLPRTLEYCSLWGDQLPPIEECLPLFPPNLIELKMANPKGIQQAFYQYRQKRLEAAYP